MVNLSKEYNRKFTIAHYGVMGIAIICVVCGFAGLSPDLAKAVEATGLTEEGVKWIGSYTYGMSMMLAGFIIAMINMLHNNSGRNELVKTITKVEELEEKVGNLNKEIAELKSGRTEDHDDERRVRERSYHDDEKREIEIERRLDAIEWRLEHGCGPEEKSISELERRVKELERHRHE